MLRERVIRLRGSSRTHRPFPLRHLVCRLTAICSARGLSPLLPILPHFPSFPPVLRCLPRITVSCPSRIRICPRIRHVWGPDRIYRALNAAYRKSISGSHSQQQLLFTSPSPLSSLALEILFFSRSITLVQTPSCSSPPFALFLLAVLFLHFFILYISVCQLFLSDPPSRGIFQRAASAPQTTAKFFSHPF